MTGSTFFPKRTTPKGILRRLPLRIDADGNHAPLLGSIKDLADWPGSAHIPNFQTRWSQLYGPSGNPSGPLHDEMRELIIKYVESEVKLIPGVSSAMIREAFDAAARRLAGPRVTVVDDLLETADLNDRTQWDRVFFIAMRYDPLLQKRVRDAIFNNLLDSARKRPTVDIRLLLGTPGQAAAYQHALTGSLWGDLQALLPSASINDVKDLFGKASETLKIETHGNSLPMPLDDFAVAVLIGHNETYVTNVGPQPLKNDEQAMDLWESIAAQLKNMEPVKPAHHEGHKQKIGKPEKRVREPQYA